MANLLFTNFTSLNICNNLDGIIISITIFKQCNMNAGKQRDYTFLTYYVFFSHLALRGICERCRSFALKHKVIQFYSYNFPTDNILFNNIPMIAL